MIHCTTPICTNIKLLCTFFSFLQSPPHLSLFLFHYKSISSQHVYITLHPFLSQHKHHSLHWILSKILPSSSVHRFCPALWGCCSQMLLILLLLTVLVAVALVLSGSADFQLLPFLFLCLWISLPYSSCLPLSIIVVSVANWNLSTL